MSTTDDLKRILADALQLGERTQSYDASTPLLGAIPELDSMAVVNLIAAMEEYYGFTVNDDELSADTFATLGSLSGFVESKLN
jgi:acyl carrier protein